MQRNRIGAGDWQSPYGNIIHIKAIAAEGERYGVKAISPRGQLYDVKGVKMFQDRVETEIAGVPVAAPVKALPSAVAIDY